MGRRASPILPLLAVLLVILVAAPALAQSSPILVDRTDGGKLSADTGVPATASYRLFNLNSADDIFIRIRTESFSGWAVTVGAEGEDPTGFFLAPRATVNVTFDFEPTAAVGGHEFKLTFEFIHGKNGETTRLVEQVFVDSDVPPRILGIVANPLPAPLDNSYGTFLIEMVFWIGTGFASILVGDTVVRILTSRASNQVTREILHKLRRPVFYLVLFLGLARSFAILPRTAVTDFIARTLLAVGVGIFGLYVVYRVLDSALLYYAKEIAPRTETTVDDLLVPLIRKVGISVLYVVGVVMVLRRLGWDPTIIFAGAGIAGLVLAFAAQDTFSNLFSGVFILLDRPFKEGDDIRLETGEVVRVESIGLRTTRLYYPRNHEQITLPNNHLATKRVVNLSGPDHRYWMMIDVGAAYAEDPVMVTEVLLEAARSHPLVCLDEGWQPVVIFKAFGESSLDFMLRFSVRNFRDRFSVASDLRYTIKKEFDDKGIEIPFPQRTLWIRQEDEQAPLRLNSGPEA